MKVSELFEAGNEQVDIKVMNAAKKWTAIGEVNGRRAEFTAFQMTTKFQGKPINSWEIEFTTEDMEGGQSLDQTGMGDEFKVFSFVNTALKAFIKAKNPPIVSWTSEKNAKGDSRARLYARVFKKVFSNYVIKTADRNDKEFSITIATKKGAK